MFSVFLQNMCFVMLLFHTLLLQYVIKARYLLYSVSIMHGCISQWKAARLVRCYKGMEDALHIYQGVSLHYNYVAVV